MRTPTNRDEPVANGFGPKSLWHDTLEPGDTGAPRPPLAGDREADVAIVGAGFTGVWTAYYLLRADPSLRVIVLERETAGFGASGRNGGWCVGDQAAALGVLDKHGGPGAAARMVRAVQASVDEVGVVSAAESIDCGYAKGGALLLASSATQLRRLTARARQCDAHGLPGTFRVLDTDATAGVVRAHGVVGALHTDHAAAVHPARLVRGVARAAERLGATIVEQTAATAIEPGRVRTEHGTVRAEVIVRATEAYTRSLRGQRRVTLPLANFLVATEPIDDATWAEIGLAGRELFEDSRLMLGYGQRTADGRIAWGGLTTRYRWASRTPPTPMHSRRAAQQLRDRLVQLFPPLRGIGLSHHWSGVLGISRDLRPSVGLDRRTGLAWAGGYFGAGVAAANLAGATLADLITDQRTDRTELPWVDHRSRSWEPEPLRWLGVHAATTGARLADTVDLRRPR
ncbi:MAG TPA: FAD-binding oxidoreductase [Acidimicrobiales bacterium]|jgi:glycine/D-amino acid oxidase-like deaminating enzyme|nr:FAD-binding oxidoreductase [Acidimicrobiales bacterium]